MKFVFSCLEYLYDEDFALRENRNGILYWETPWIHTDPSGRIHLF